MGITKVGPREPGDGPRKKRRWFEKIWRGAWFFWLVNSLRNPFAWIIFWRVQDAEDKAKAAKVEDPWHGLPEADLTEQERLNALHRMKYE